jgi:uncharacterized protein with GYD domain
MRGRAKFSATLATIALVLLGLSAAWNNTTAPSPAVSSPTAEGGSTMAKFLIQGSYTAGGVKGVIKEGGSARKAAVQKALEGLGGKLDSFYYTFGADDVIVICELPDTITGLALSLAVNASGTVRISTTALMSVEDVDAACKKAVSYRPAGA